ncbi:MAG: hypothetical protein AB2A00_36290 [Myxococcota bacterium]
MPKPLVRTRARVAALAGSALAIAGASLLVAAANPPAAIPSKTVNGPALYPLSKVKPGLILKGESVFSTAGLEPFEATVLAVMEDYLGPGEDLILARLTGPAMERYGVVSGMSGSPVYADGQLVGAVSYRFGAFPKEAIAGITPAESMVAILKDRSARMEQEKNKRNYSALPMTPWGEARPIAAPLVCGGCPDAVLAEYGPKLQEMGFTPMRGGAGASNQEFPIYAGGPIAGALVDGDVNMVALGTITYVNDKEVLAFGHPFIGSGSAEVPMASAEVYATIPSLSGSSKLGRAGRVVGALLDDRLTAIAGRMGMEARTVPFNMVLDRPGELDARKDVKFRVVDDLGVGATLTDLAVSGAIMNRVGFESVGTVRLKGSVTLENGTVIPMDQLFSGVPNRNPTYAAASMVGDVMEMLWRNPFERVRFKSVDLTVKHHEEPMVGALTRASVAQPRVRAGQPFKVALDILTHRHGLRRMEVEFPTDERMEPGVYSIVVADREEAEEIDKEAALVPLARNLDDVVKNVMRTRKQDRLYAYFLDRVKGAKVGGLPMAELPPSMLAILQDGQDGPAARKQPRRAMVVKALDPGVMVTGKAEIEVQVLPPRSR